MTAAAGPASSARRGDSHVAARGAQRSCPTQPRVRIRRRQTTPRRGPRLVRGRALLNRGTADDVRQAIAAFEAAIAADPAFAAAWAKLAEARHLLVMMGAARPLDAYAAARDEAARAVAADATLADAHVAAGPGLALVRLESRGGRGRFERALRAQRQPRRGAPRLRVVAASRSAATTKRSRHHARARSRSAVGARQQRHRLALSASPSAGGCRTRLPAHARHRSDRARSPGLPGARVLAARAVGRRPAARRARRCRPMPSRRSRRQARRARTRCARCGSGGSSGSSRRRGRAGSAPTRWRCSTCWSATTRARSTQLERARDEQSGMLVLAGHDPAIDPLRGDPRFRALLETITPAR